MSLGLEQRLEQFLDALEEAVLLVDGQSPDGMGIVRGNRSASTLLGYSGDELARLSLVDLRVPGDVRAGSAYEARRSQGAFAGAVGVRRKDGSSFEAQVRSVSLTSADGQGLVAIVIHDLTDELRLAETTAALRESEALRQVLADAAFEGLVLHADGVILSVNRAAEVMFRVPTEKIVGRPLFDFIAPESHALVLERIRAGDERVYEAVGRREDGTSFPVEAQARTSSVTVAGRHARVVAVRDLSERHALEEQVRQAQKMEAVGRLAGGVAHDFNNLLAVIIGAASSAREALGPEHPSADELSDVLDAAERATALTRQLLAFGRKQLLDPRVVELDGAVQKLEAMFRRLVPENITLRIAPGAPGTHVRIDLAQLEMALMNLVGNACAAMPGGGTLTVTTEAVDLGPSHARAHAEGRQGPHALLVVRDTGIGMDAATLARIFEPFFTTRARSGGTGLGLATVFGAVKQAGGSIWAESAPGEGARFTIALPRVDEVTTPSGVEARREAPKAGRTILLVEDEPAVRSVTRRLLVRAGYEVLEASDGAEALAIAERHAGPIHLLLSDMVMPGLDGRQVAEAVRARRPDVPVLLMSGYTERALPPGEGGRQPTAFLAKPAPPAVLLAKVAELLG